MGVQERQEKDGGKETRSFRKPHEDETYTLAELEITGMKGIQKRKGFKTFGEHFV